MSIQDSIFIGFNNITIVCTKVIKANLNNILCYRNGYIMICSPLIHIVITVNIYMAFFAVFKSIISNKSHSIRNKHARKIGICECFRLNFNHSIWNNNIFNACIAKERSFSYTFKIGW